MQKTNVKPMLAQNKPIKPMSMPKPGVKIVQK